MTTSDRIAQVAAEVLVHTAGAVFEYVVALTAGNTGEATKRAQQIDSIEATRQEIKERYPKPEVKAEAQE
jgi:hypothetical protein